MSFLTSNYVKLKKHFYRKESIDFTKLLGSYKNILIHPVMEPGIEIFSIPTIVSIVKHLGSENVELLINKKFKFFFNNIPAGKIIYEDFASHLSSNYKKLKRNIEKKQYDLFIEMNRFDDELLTLFGLLPRASIRICLDSEKENPVYNMVITSNGSSSEVDRNNLVLKPLGIKRKRKRIKWEKPQGMKVTKGKICIAMRNYRIGVKLFSVLKNLKFTPVFFLDDPQKVQAFHKNFGSNVMSIYPIENTYPVFVSCERVITSINHILSLSLLLKKRTLLFLEKDEQPGKEINTSYVKVFLPGSRNFIFERAKTFVMER